MKTREQANYPKLLMDENIFLDIQDIVAFARGYDTIAYVTGDVLTEKTIFIWKDFERKIDQKLSWLDFMIECKRKEDIKNWLYLSKDLLLIGQMQQTGFDSCFISTPTNNTIDIFPKHEIRRVEDIAKILK